MGLLNMLGLNLPTLNPFQGLLNGSGAMPGLIQNPMSNIQPAANGFTGVLQHLLNPNNTQSAGPPMLTQGGSQGGWGAQPGAGPFVSQDERGSLQERTGLTPEAQTAAPQQKPAVQLPQMTGTESHAGKTYDQGSIPDSYYASIRAAESGGNDRAKNPTSSAAGRYQFTSGTWNSVASAHPELGLTPDGRFDPNQQERAIRAFTQDNARILQTNGIPLSGGSLYAAHFLGVGGASHVYRQPDTALMRDVVGPGVVAANGFLRGMTVGQFKSWAAKKGGGGGASGGVDVSTTPSGYRMAEGEYNTAVANPRNPKERRGGGGSVSGGTGPDSGGGGGSHKNSVSADFKRYQARKNIAHLRGLSPVATIQALENIGKGLRTQGGGRAA